MEITNVSAQLFNKQLKPSELASYYGCKDDINTNYLTTCVDSTRSDAALENTFQKQLDLSDYYKGKTVFENVKKDFMDKAMGQQISDEQMFPLEEPPKPPVAKKIIPDGPRDFLEKSVKAKEFFGKSRSNGILNNILILIAMTLLIILVLKFLSN
uniref:Uncharacterized protein n=1 Tax=viral metagenome TaxID=1070528 RepID=A0A6C0IA23_9ZZZZ